MLARVPISLKGQICLNPRVFRVLKKIRVLYIQREKLLDSGPATSDGRLSMRVSEIAWETIPVYRLCRVIRIYPSAVCKMVGNLYDTCVGEAANYRFEGVEKCRISTILIKHSTWFL